MKLLAPDQSIARHIRDYLGADTDDYAAIRHMPDRGLSVRIGPMTIRISEEHYGRLQSRPWDRDVLEQVTRCR